MSLQQQLQDLSQQIADLSKQVEQSSAQALPEDTINYEQLIKLAKQRQFTGHLADKQDSYIKTVYMQTLFSVVNQAEEAIEDCLLLATCIADSMGAAENIRQYVTKSYTLTEQDMTDFLVVMKEQQLIEAFALDALMIIGIHLEKALMQNVIALMSLLEIPETHFVEICQLTNAILTKNHKDIQQFLLDATYLKRISKCYMPTVFKEIYIDDRGKKEKHIHSLMQLIDKRLTKRVVIRNAKVEVDEAAVIHKLTELTLENCQIYSPKLDVSFENINILKLKNINSNTCKIYKEIKLSNIPFVEIDKLKITDRKIRADYPIVVKKCKKLILTNSKITNNIVEPQNNYIRQKNYKGSLQESQLLLASFIHHEGNTKIELMDNQFEDNKVRTAKLTTLINQET